MPRFHSITFGCRANQADTAALEHELIRRGFQSTCVFSQADIVILNSCTVTAAADSELRQTARRIHRQNPAAQILVTGCYAQRESDKLSRLEGVRWVVGNSHKAQIGALLAKESCAGKTQNCWVPLSALSAGGPCGASDELSGSCTTASFTKAALRPSAQILAADLSGLNSLAAAPLFGGALRDRTRPNLKIQDGCNSRCSFCIIPSVRGGSRSLVASEVVEQVRGLCDRGHREIVLSGINLGQYGRDLAGRPRFVDLIRKILKETPAERLRLSSVEPMDFTDELLDVMACSDRIAKHIHAPLQSGSDRILRRMHRKYRANQYRERILAAWERMPNAAFGADVIVGFPGESAEDFQQTRGLIENLPFTYLHVFPFSARPGTPAAAMKGALHGRIVRERSRILRELAARKNRSFRERQIGRELIVLTLDDPSAGGTGAMSENYLKVFLPGERMPANEWVRTRILSLNEEGLLGSLKTEWKPGHQFPSEKLPSTITCASA